MTKKSIAIVLSFLVAIMPFLGFPETFDKYFYLLAGIALAGLVELVSIHYCATCDTLVDHDEEVFDVYKDPEPAKSEEKGGAVYYEEVVEEVVYSSDEVESAKEGGESEGKTK